MTWKEAIRPVLAVGSLIALIWFYTLMAFGNDVPPEIHGFWVPITYWFVERTVRKSKGE